MVISTYRGDGENGPFCSHSFIACESVLNATE